MDNQNNNLDENKILNEAADNPAPKRTDEKQGIGHTVLEYAEMLVFAVVAVLLIFTFAFRLCQVQGSSMNNTLQHGEMVITTNLFYTPKQDDIIVFHQTEDPDGTSAPTLGGKALNEPVIKRVIATEGQTVKITYISDNEMIIEVDGVKYEDVHAYLDPIRHHIYPQHGETDVANEFIFEVPDGHVFVLGDNRDNSNDSRSQEIGFVDTRRILGKALFRVKPFTWLS